MAKSQSALAKAPKSIGLSIGSVLTGFASGGRGLLSLVLTQFLTSKKYSFSYGQAETQSPTPMHLKLLNSPLSMKAPGRSVRPTGQTLAQSLVLQLMHVLLSLTLSLNSPSLRDELVERPPAAHPCRGAAVGPDERDHYPDEVPEEGEVEGEEEVARVSAEYRDVDVRLRGEVRERGAPEERDPDQRGHDLVGAPRSGS